MRKEQEMSQKHYAQTDITIDIIDPVWRVEIFWQECSKLESDYEKPK